MTSEDKRLYAKLTLDFSSAPKIAPLSDRSFRQYIEVLLWSTRLMTDGFVPNRMIPKLLAPESVVELTSNDPFTPSLLVVEGGLMIHDFAKHQNTKSKIEAKREAGRLGGLAKASKTLAPARTTRLAPAKGDVDVTLSNIDLDLNIDSTKRGHRIPNNFAVTDDMRDWGIAKAPGVDISEATEKFINYWKARSSNATRLDWVATWRNWILNEKKFSTTAGPNSSRNLDIVAHYASIKEH